jgi:hypothetical protein
MVQTNWAEHLKTLIDTYPLVILVTIVVAFIGHTTTIIQAIGKSKTFYNSHLGWKRMEEKVINSLAPAMHIAKFHEVLGAPLFCRKSDSGYAEYVYKRRGYWVQAITDTEGSVVLYAVTSCSERFRPRIKNNPVGVPVRLRTTTFKAAAGEYEPDLHYSISGATANSYLIEKLYLGNPSHYQTVFWGYNDACSNKWADDSLPVKLYSYLRECDNAPNINNSLVDTFRANNTFNTFAVASPFVDPTEIMQAFQVGIDRIQVRIYPNT